MRDIDEVSRQRRAKGTGSRSSSRVLVQVRERSTKHAIPLGLNRQKKSRVTCETWSFLGAIFPCEPFFRHASHRRSAGANPRKKALFDFDPFLTGASLATPAEGESSARTSSWKAYSEALRKPARSSERYHPVTRGPTRRELCVERRVRATGVRRGRNDDLRPVHGSRGRRVHRRDTGMRKQR